MPREYFWDGTRYVPLLGGLTVADGDARYVRKAGDTMTGPLVLGADATADMEAVTRRQLTAGTDPPGARRVFNFGSQVVATGGAAKLTAWSASGGGEDTGDGLMTYSGGTITFTEAMIVDIGLMVGASYTSASGRRVLDMYYDGTSFPGNAITYWATTTNSGGVGHTIIGAKVLAGGTLYTRFLQDSGANCTVNGGRWSIRRVAKG